MSEAPPNWPRKYYEPGGQLPFLFYIVFGASVEDLKVSRSKHRCDRIPEGLEVMAYGPAVHPEVLDQFRSGYLWEELRKTHPDLADTVAAQTQCVVLQGSCADASTLNYFRDAIGLVAALLESGGVAVFDPQSFKWWSRSDWTSTVFEPAQPLPREHVVILVSDEGGVTEWYHTRGLRKFGRPDLSFRGVTPDKREAVADLFNRFIENQAFGGVIDEHREINLKSLPLGIFCTHHGDVDDPNFNNFHVEMKWPGSLR